MLFAGTIQIRPPEGTNLPPAKNGCFFVSEVNRNRFLTVAAVTQYQKRKMPIYYDVRKSAHAHRTTTTTTTATIAAAVNTATSTTITAASYTAVRCWRYWWCTRAALTALLLAPGVHYRYPAVARPSNPSPVPEGGSCRQGE